MAKETSEQETSEEEPSEVESVEKSIPRCRSSKRSCEEAVTGIKSGIHIDKNKNGYSSW